MPSNAEIAAVLDQVADLLEFEGANAFRVRAYRNGGRTIGDLPESVQAILDDESRQLTDISGIGKDLAEKIETLATTGSLPFLEELLERIPESVLALLRIPGLGPKKAAVLYRELNIANLDQLKAACEAGEVRQLKGFAAKTEQAILEGIELAAKANERIYWAKADAIAQALLTHLDGCPAVQRREVTGSYRRGRETVGDLDILVESDDATAVMDHFDEFPDIASQIGRGDTKMSVRLESGLQVDLRVVDADAYGAALLYFTGSKAHNIVLRGRAKDRGLKINEYGIFRDDEYLAGREEEDVYRALDLPWIPPPLREARREFEWADADDLPKLVELADIRGDLHMHTTATDGKHTLEEMIAAAQQRKLKYIAITDHSKRVSMAGGLDAKRLRAQWAEIDRLRESTSGIQILKGIECDILEKGGLDLDDEVLAEADWVVCSVHYGQNQPQEQITRRIIGAIENPHVSAIAHPTGRLINRRKPYAVDLDAVMAAAHEHGKLLELNSNPARLDLDDVACAAAKAHGVKIVISTDAHHTEGLDVMRYGILQAQRGGLTKNDVANTRTWAQLRKLIGH
ncbi:MAG: DNA polymerase/3'-5' exonuclease PolX [Planctomycetota bacterium]|nr:MAG: DNA polymerase/3'-5' exonuclease PolX [Planctomycetota bacterium]REJ88654.1 MAG: DNA polymerase/3'-5' exonuclease PolX [Planctomycetota bacterium]